jgi:hypothetical protein
MKVLFISTAGALITIAALASARSSANQATIPNLVGTWSVSSQGATLLHGTGYSKRTHHAEQFTTLNAEAVIQKQEGRRFIGILKSARYTEKFAGAISVDGKSMAFVDEDGFLDGKIINNNLIEVTYRHIGNTESVAATGTYTRRQPS